MNEQDSTEINSKNKIAENSLHSEEEEEKNHVTFHVFSFRWLQITIARHIFHVDVFVCAPRNPKSFSVSLSTTFLRANK